MKNVFDIEEYFTDKEIIKILCRKRALAAKKAHDNHFLRNISEGAQNPHKVLSKEIFNYFPPRSEWVRLNLKERNKRNTNALEMNLIQLERTIWREKKSTIKTGCKKVKWLENLDAFIDDIRENTLNIKSDYSVPTPKTIPVLKDKVKNEYRPISYFELKDLIIIGQVSKYLTNCFDQLFLDCSYAFRSGINNPK